MHRTLFAGVRQASYNAGIKDSWIEDKIRKAFMQEKYGREREREPKHIAGQITELAIEADFMTRSLPPCDNQQAHGSQTQ